MIMKTIGLITMAVTLVTLALAQPQENIRKQNVEVVDQFFVKLEQLNIEEWITLWAEDGKQIMPFSPVGFPKELTGRDAIYNQYKGLPDNYTSMRFPRKILPMHDPDKVLVQYEGIISLEGGGEYNNTYIGLFELENGKIRTFTEYFNPIILQEAFGKALQENFNVNKN